METTESNKVKFCQLKDIALPFNCRKLDFDNIYRPQRSCEGYVFTPVCHSVHRGGVPEQVPPQDQVDPPDQVHPLGRYTPGTRYTLQTRYTHPPRTRYIPQTRYIPWDQVHPPTPPGPGTLPRAGTPQDQVHPPGPDTPQDQVHPPSRRLLLWMVCILLECILVTTHNEVEARLYYHRHLWFCPRGGAWSGGICSQGVCSRGVPGGDPPGTTTAAGGTYPTGMHSCWSCICLL